MRLQDKQKARGGGGRHGHMTRTHFPGGVLTNLGGASLFLSIPKISEDEMEISLSFYGTLTRQRLKGTSLMRQHSSRTTFSSSPIGAAPSSPRVTGCGDAGTA